ncbi:hypothetical protein niasHT_014928 [Heterodera trifolii]|uniref:DNA helicase n=1 Tax=Heterodera trifolii TaxID=157864 RepID=A0ABD2LH75_9BILA
MNNHSILATFTTEYIDYLSEDKPLEAHLLEVNAADYDVTQINLLNPAGMPAHHIKLKKGGSSRSGIVVAIPRITTTYKEKRSGGVSFERFQFPGQTCEKLGIDFTEESFAHGQTYTAFSRATNSDAIRVYAPNKPIDSEGFRCFCLRAASRGGSLYVCRLQQQQLLLQAKMSEMRNIKQPYPTNKRRREP